MLKFEIEKQIRSVKDEMVWLFKTALFYGSFGALILLWINFLYEPWPIFSNPIKDFLFMRSGGPLLYANHVSSTIAILAVTTYFVIKQPRQVTRTMIVILSTVSLHEIILDTVMGPVTQWAGWNENYAANIQGLSSFFSMNFRWAFWLALILVLGLALSNKWQRRKLGKIGLFILGYVLIWFVYLVVSHHSPWTIIEFKPGPMFLDPIDNSIEVFSWILPMGLWITEDVGLWFQWHVLIKELHPHNYLRYLLFYRNSKTPLVLDVAGKFHFMKEMREWEREYLPNFSLEGKTVLDVGAGSGDTAYFFFQHGAKKVICIEPNRGKTHRIAINASKHNWNVEIREKKFEISDLEGDISFAKIDAEFGEIIMLKLDRLPDYPIRMEIHSKELAEQFKAKFPQMQITKKYIMLSTWLGKYDPEI